MNISLELEDKLTRVVVCLRFEQYAEVNITEHIVTRQFSEDGFCIDNTYFKLYAGEIGQIKNHYVKNGFGAGMFIVGSKDDDIRGCEELLINEIKSEVEAQLTKTMKFKELVSDPQRNYINEVDRTPWGKDNWKS
ncbi:hypothetical protein A8L34_27890 [Bacillus sp. FJAT-27264]|uniref:hypothetical protein n=1 Tax=Paenibacillus sp. (strain DSM 101736 / FJAT-27264) TaxID=1850362 RepID=UPI000807CF28|nr:hypothetical protein [Bacillus sp. FJAT-27264]OBZ15871.1 hypothetical protein A8L34_27890 [Bacillus sp. FJAT-27264]